MRTRTMVTGIALIAIVAAGVFASDTVLGRDVARDGSPAVLAGSLVFDQEEWFLRTDEGTYELHMGPLGHDGSLPWSDGSGAVVKGFALPDHLAPISVETDDGTVEFWHESRYPLWAGDGARRNAVEDGHDGLALRRFAPAEDELTSDAPRGRTERDEQEPLFRNQVARPGRGR